MAEKKSDKKIFIVPESDAGRRADVFLAERLPEFSRAAIQKMEKNLSNSHRLKVGEELWIYIDAPMAEPAPRPEARGMPLTVPIIFEDDDIIVADKPRGMVMYPAAGNRDGTLAQMLAGHCRLSPLGGGVRPGVVHRIDKDTSGIVILAKSDAAFRALVKTFAGHNLTRKYLAFAWNIPTWTEADIEGNIARSSRNRQKMSMVKTGGRAAKTEAAVINVWPRADICEMRCTLLTGRTHQIRVHLSAHGFPVVSDPLYGRGKEAKIKSGALLSYLRGQAGQRLHAEVLELPHPITGEPLKFRSPLPEDLKELKRLLDEY